MHLCLVILTLFGIGQVNVNITDSGMFTTLEKINVLAYYVLQQAQNFRLNVLPLRESWLIFNVLRTLKK